MESSAETMPAKEVQRIVNTETFVSTDGSPVLPTDEGDKEAQIKQVTGMLKDQELLGLGQHLVQMGTTDERALGDKEVKRNLKEAGIIQPWYKRIINPIKFFRSLFGRKQHEVIEAKEQTTQFQIVKGDTQPRSGTTPLPKAA